MKIFKKILIILCLFSINIQAQNVEEDIDNVKGVSFYDGKDHTLVVDNNSLYSTRIKIPPVDRSIIDNLFEGKISGGVLSIVTNDGDLYTTTVSYILKNGFEVRIKDEIEPLKKENISNVFKADFSSDSYAVTNDLILYKKDNNEWKKIEIPEVYDFAQAKDGSLFVTSDTNVIVYMFSDIQKDYLINNYNNTRPTQVKKVQMPEVKENYYGLTVENTLSYDGYEVVLKYDQKDVSLVFRNGDFHWKTYVAPEFNLEYIETQYNPNLELGEYIIVNSLQFDVPVLALEKTTIETNKGIINFKNPQIEIVSPFPKNELERQKMNTIIEIENKEGKLFEKRQSGLIYQIK